MSSRFDALSDADIDRIAQLVEILERSSFDHLTLELGEVRLTVGTGAPPGGALDRPAVAPAPAAPVAPSPAPDEAAAGPRASAPAPTAPAPEEGLVEITAPTMGNFYARPDPASPPFVTEGATVSADSTVGLVEVMKLFNSVTAGTAGTIVQICVEDAAVVEFGQVLMRLRPAP